MSNTRRPRGLNYRRLSHDTDESTSLERQDEQNTAMGIAKGIDWAASLEDADVSGAISPFDREALGPYLTDPDLIASWDVLVIAKLDRLSRSIIDFGKLLEWCRVNGKSIISVSESIDFSTSVGWIFGNILMMFAQFERMRISERRSEAAAKLRKVARWNGGPFPFGYRPVCMCHRDAKCARAAGWELTVDVIDAWIVRRMADMAIAHKSGATIARWLKDSGIPTPHDGYKREKRVAKGDRQWTGNSVRTMLANPSLRGYVVQVMDGTGKRFRNKDTNKVEPRIIRDDDGTPVQREPILDDPTWYKLQAALKVTSREQYRGRHDAHPLLGVGSCRKCNSSYWAKRNKPGESRQEYYICADRHASKCNARSIPMALLDARVEAEITARYSRVFYPEKTETPGIDNRDAIEIIDNLIAELDEAHDAGDLPTSAYARRITKLEKDKVRLEAEQKPRCARIRSADDTVAERFSNADLEGRRQIMLALGIRVIALYAQSGELFVELEETMIGLLENNMRPAEIIESRMESNAGRAEIIKSRMENSVDLGVDQSARLADLATR